MPDDRCKDCIENARPVTPTPIGMNVASQQLAWLAREDPVARQAQTLLHWAIDQHRQGRVVLSGDPTTGELQRLHMPALEPKV
jgi:hypothetical protein